MRIIYLLSRFEPIGGQEFYLARQQMLQGHEVLIVTSSLHYPLQNLRERYRLEGLSDEAYEQMEGERTFEGLRVVRLSSPFHYHDFVFIRGLKKIFATFKPDIVFGHEPRTIVPVLGAWYKRLFRYVYFLDSHDFFHKVQNHTWWQRLLRYVEYFWWRKFFVQYALSRADKIIAVAGECRRFLEERHGIRPERISDLPLGVDTDYFHFDEHIRSKGRQALGYQSADIVLLFSGYMFRRKALESLIDALAHLHDLPLKLLLVGEGPSDYLEELREQTRKHNLDHRVHFFGFAARAHMNELYCAADIGIWPGNNTLAILEAMSCRLPLIIADMQLAHLAKYDNGLLIPYADVPTLERAIRTLATDGEKRIRMGENSVSAIRSDYSYKALGIRLTRWMEEAVKKQGTVGQQPSLVSDRKTQPEDRELGYP